MGDQQHGMLPWPDEMAAVADSLSESWEQEGSNILLDFHGDPLRAGLVVFSDGNHHMALGAAQQRFVQMHPESIDVFYATTPPGVLTPIFEGPLRIGNLLLSRRTDIFIGPDAIVEQLNAKGHFDERAPFMKSRAVVMLVRRGNPKKINRISDLLRPDVRLALSNPVAEKASYQIYSHALHLAGEHEGADDILREKSGNVIYSQKIHHREIPQILVRDLADVSVVYYHLALRYTRIFPDLFDFLPFAGDRDNPDSLHEDCITLINALTDPITVPLSV